MRLRASLFTVCAGVVLLAGCHRHFTRERFELIRENVDTREDVREMLGKPTAQLGEQWIYDDVKRNQTARIHFDEQGRVTAKEWIDARAGTWEGRDPNAPAPPPGEVRERSTRTRRIDID
ncbi:MAG: hypothetical protein AB1716_07875 [Planctomycetota bacterium]